jgi:biotin synthase
MEVCMTLGMLDEAKAKALKDAGVTAYNHNIDTSREFYPKVITSRTIDDRLNTLKNVREAGISVCSGGIIGMGESEDDRIGFLQTLATLPEHPESVPVNALVAIEGTPLENQPRVSVFEMMRMIATARIIMPKSMVRLSAGRSQMPVSEQALCFQSGANSIFTGEKLLTTPNPDFDEDMQMFQTLGLEGKPANYYITEKADGSAGCSGGVPPTEEKTQKMAA